jgi:signal transduction histidine kinase
VAGVLGAAGLAWIWSLRRKVRERTIELATANAQLSGEVEERKKAQAELNRALATEREVSELKGRFVSLVSHEFRTPLGITMSAVELLRNYLDRLPAAKLKELLDDIYSSTLRMSGLMEQVLLLGRVEAGKLGLTFAPLDVAAFGHKLVDETLSAMNRKCPVQFHATNDLDDASGDEALLRHIFSNLLSNAVKYSPNGGLVEFSVQRAGTDALFTVRDCGIGIPEADQAHLFEAFHRAVNVSQIPGTGLGLLIVKRCIELHGGSIKFESCVGSGTTFDVRLPLFSN